MSIEEKRRQLLKEAQELLEKAKSLSDEGNTEPEDEGFENSWEESEEEEEWEYSEDDDYFEDSWEDSGC